jgi:hypothetical protein
MHPHLAKVVPEARLKEGTRRVWQGLPTPLQPADLLCYARGGLRRLAIDGTGHHLPFYVFERLPLDAQTLCSARRALAIEADLAAARALSLHLRLRHAHHLLGHPVGLLLIRVAGLVDRQLCLGDLRRRMVHR